MTLWVAPILLRTPDLRLARSQRWILLALGVLAVVTVASVGDQEDAVLWSEVEERALAIEVPFSGRARSLQVAEYGPPPLTRVWDYRITFLAPEGSAVAAGEPVLRFDVTELEQSLRRHQADRDAAAKQYEQRRKEFEAQLSEQELAFDETRAEERRAEISADLPPELVARSKLEKAAVDLELARRELEHRRQRIADLGRRSGSELAILRDRRDRAAAAVADIERSIELMTVRATSAGMVSHRADKRGAKKKVGDSCWRGERVLEIPAPGALRIDAWVKEAVSGGLRTGQPATLWLEAQPDRSFTAKVETIQQTVERWSGPEEGPIVRIELSLEDPGAVSMRPEMRVQGNVELERRPARLAVRAAAVIASPAGPMVSIKRMFGPVARPVEVGVRSGDWVEILGGLDAGERVRMPR